ncbi:MAG: D-alanyl-D-alanine carboxypeptidase [bacterium]|nr:D-alanyl-D-alanine carboxypeptidase [bacterium]
MLKDITAVIIQKPLLILEIILLSVISLFLIPPQPVVSQINQITQSLNHTIPALSIQSQLEIPSYPTRGFNTAPPSLSARAYLIKDLDSKVIIAAKNPDTPLPIASLTKLMTALVALESYPPKTIIPITIDADQVEGQKIGLKKGEKYTLETLVASSIIHSANDAALNLAAYHPKGIKGFVYLMNQKAKQLNMNKTHFTNPVGYDNPDHYSTVSDLALLAEAVLDNPLITAFAQTPMMRMVEVTSGRVVTLKTTNDLLGRYPGVLGLKTGWTEKAGECLISLVESKTGGKWYLSIMLGSQDRFGETILLKNWVDANIRWTKIKPENF